VARVPSGRRLQVERALRESEARWRAITDLLPQIIWSASAQGNQEEAGAVERPV
jgi:PAS domain-containing protein